MTDQIGTWSRDCNQMTIDGTNHFTIEEVSNDEFIIGGAAQSCVGSRAQVMVQGRKVMSAVPAAPRTTSDPSR